MRNAYLVWSIAAFRGPRSILAPAWRRQGAGAATGGTEAALAVGAAHWQVATVFRAAGAAAAPWYRATDVPRRRSGRPMEEAAARRRGEEGRQGTGAERKEAARPANRVTGGTRSRSESE